MIISLNANCHVVSAVWELVQRAARQLFSLWWRLCGDGVARRRTLERRTLQLPPRIHLQERHLWVNDRHFELLIHVFSSLVWLFSAAASSRVSCSPIEDLTLLNFFISLMWATAKGPKRLHVRKGSTEIWDWCGRALSLCSGFPAETESSDQVFVWRKVGETPDPLYPW